MVQQNIVQDRLQDLFPVHYRNGNILMINADCMDVMAHIQDNEVELSCVDPPYGIGVSEMNIGARDAKNISCDNKGWDNHIPSREYFLELRRVSIDQIVFGANYFNCFSGGHGAIIWNKNNPMPTQSDCEIASYSKHRKVAIYNQTWTNYVNTKSTSHPTEKPVALYKWLLSRYAKPGDRILDTHGGSGSICIAAHDLGFDLTWIELDADYYKAACKRYQNHAAQATLFAPEEIRQPVQAALL